MTTDSTSGGQQTQSSDPEDRLAYITLGLVPGLGARRIGRLLSRFGSARAVLAASSRDLAAQLGMTPAATTSITSASARQALAILATAEQHGQQILVPADDEFPATLRSIPDPPVLLFVRGTLDALRRPAVAIVGSRSHSGYGAEVAATMANAAAHAGIVVVSGMARGLDAVAQNTALDVGGMSIGVLGTGADIVYPLENRSLFDRIVGNGLLLTEHPPGEQAFRGAFPRRNRLISGLARVLVVIEAAAGSGTLVTVTSALEQGREVLVVPGPITSRTSVGTNQLLRDGATPLLAPDDLLRAFGLVSTTVSEPRLEPPPCNLSPDEARVLSAIYGTPRSVDAIADVAGLPIGMVLATLLGLELGGLITQLADATYQRR
ncbi:MAG TPA: DNA-processing protein DprA [Gemmatimonadales bacterium]